MRAQLRPSPGTLPLVALAGGLDLIANVLYLLGSREGLLSLVAVLTSMYPASTVLLARIVLKERMNKWQAMGLACAGLGVALIAGG
jgi:drug/metabolite transporter (DMT)-like permease